MVGEHRKCREDLGIMFLIFDLVILFVIYYHQTSELLHMAKPPM